MKTMADVIHAHVLMAHGSGVYVLLFSSGLRGLMDIHSNIPPNTLTTHMSSAFAIKRYMSVTLDSASTMTNMMDAVIEYSKYLSGCVLFLSQYSYASLSGHAMSVCDMAVKVENANMSVHNLNPSVVMYSVLNGGMIVSGEVGLSVISVYPWSLMRSCV